MNGFYKGRGIALKCFSLETQWGEWGEPQMDDGTELVGYIEGANSVSLPVPER